MWYKNHEKLKRNLVIPPERPKLQPIVLSDGLIEHDNFYQGTGHVVQKSCKTETQPSTTSRTAQSTAYNTRFSVVCGPGSEMAVNHTNILLAQIKLPRKF
ncbi:hypothetical protein KSS87_014087 [Heliosperma pusillum]|nr:hypothetical protein KSS87_014087 [Heliosperma pusillum]